MYEDDIEQLLIEILQELGYEYHYGPDIAPYSEDPQRQSFEDVILEQVFRESLRRINPTLPEDVLEQAFHKILDIQTQDIMSSNETIHRYLTDGVHVDTYADGETIGEQVMLVDEQHLENNIFQVVNQFVVKGVDIEKRPDVVLFVNGLPLVVIELKNATDSDATLQRAYNQIQTYKSTIPQLFAYNGLCVLSDGIEAKVSSLSAPWSRFLAWKRYGESTQIIDPEMETLARELLRPETLLDVILHYTVFEKMEAIHEQTGQKSIETIKKVAAYHQYYAVQKALDATHRAITGDHKIGVVRHTQGSGKSLSMVFYSGKLVVDPRLENPTIVVVTDRNDLDDQLFGTFGASKSLLRQEPVQASSRDHLKTLLKVAGGGIVFTTMQKFFPESGNVFETLSERTNIVVMADEAHRSQYGFEAREVLTEDGSELRYGNAKYLRDALPNASFIGFTGTPIEREDKSTRGVFGDDIDVYDIQQAVEDGATVPISYESRLAKIKIDEASLDQIDKEIEKLNASPDQIEEAKKKNAQLNALLGNKKTLTSIAEDFVQHFEARQQVFEGKAMIVCASRQIAVDLYDQIVALRAGRHSDDITAGQIKVVMSSSSDDPASFQVHHTNKQQRRDLASRFRDADDIFKIVIVQGMRLTGFDAPVLNTMYVYKKMQGANLMQAIARVNRVYKDKPGGLVVDYIGIGQALRSAMQVYTESGGAGSMVETKDDSIQAMQTSFEIVQDMFHEFDYKIYFEQDTKSRLQTLLDATNFVLGGADNLKDRFLKEITKLSKLYAMSSPSFEAESIRDEVAFFQAVKSRLSKFNERSGLSNAEVQSAIRHIVEEELSSEGVIDVFQAAGLKKPRLDILSEEFLLEVNNMKQKNIAVELLKKLLNDDIKIRQRKNIAQAKKFSEMFRQTIISYHNNQIDTIKVLEELTKIAKEMRTEDKKAQELGLTEEEYAFYCVLSENDSTKSLEDQKMKELIHRIVDIVRKTKTTMDRDKREDIRAKLRLTVKKLLQRYGYPPDLARMEADRVLEQSEAMAGE